jgi:hypothetical protein
MRRETITICQLLDCVTAHKVQIHFAKHSIREKMKLYLLIVCLSFIVFITLGKKK